MQTGKWMSYSDSMHFSDKNSYKILFISSYGSKDMIYARFCIFARIFLKTENEAGTFLTKRSEPRRLTAGPGRADWNPDTDVAPGMAADRGLPVRTGKRIKKIGCFVPSQGIELWTC
jgi:hypothetical protein